MNEKEKTKLNKNIFAFKQFYTTHIQEDLQKQMPKAKNPFSFLSFSFDKLERGAEEKQNTVGGHIFSPDASHGAPQKAKSKS